MLPPLEIVTRLNDDITLSQIKEIMTYVESLAPKYKKVRHLLSLEKCSEGYGNIISLLQFPESDVITCLMAPISTLTKIQMINKKKNIKIFGTIFSMEDVKALEKVHIPIEALVFYATPDTIPEILAAYKELQKTSLKVDDFVNIKFRIGSVGEISETNLKLLYDFSKELGDQYIYLPERDQVMNPNVPFPIKGIRPIRKLLFKFSYADAWLNVEYHFDGKIRKALFGDSMTLEEFKNMEILEEEDISTIGIKTDKCKECVLNGICNNAASKIIAPVYDSFCEEAKFNSALFYGIADIPDSEERKKKFNQVRLTLA